MQVNGIMPGAQITTTLLHNNTTNRNPKWRHKLTQWLYTNKHRWKIIHSVLWNVCKHTHTHTHMYAASLSHTHMHAASLTHTHARCLSHTHTHTCTLPLSHTHTHARCLSHTHTHMYAASLSHTHTCTLPLSHTPSILSSHLLSLVGAATSIIIVATNTCFLSQQTQILLVASPTAFRLLFHSGMWKDCHQNTQYGKEKCYRARK